MDVEVRYLVGGDRWNGQGGVAEYQKLVVYFESRDQVPLRELQGKFRDLLFLFSVELDTGRSSSLTQTKWKHGGPVTHP